MKKWSTQFDTIRNLWQDADATPERSVIVVGDLIETDFCDIRYGWARVADKWHKVVCVGDAGEWQAAWSDRQQAFVTISDEDFTEKLNAIAGLAVKSATY